MSKYTNKSGGKVVGVIISTILVIAVISVIGLIFYPEIKEAFTVTIPENVEQIKNDVKAEDKIEESETGSGTSTDKNELIGEPTIDEVIGNIVEEATQNIE